MHNIPLSLSVALLIDADNVQLSHLERIRVIADYYGNLTICHAYGDWNKRPLSAYCDKVDSLKIVRIQVDRIGKDSSDKKLIIDASIILGKGNADLFIIASGDADFRQLCEQIKQESRKVVGIGNKKQTSTHLKESCDKFHYVEDLDNEIIRLEQTRPPEEFRTLVYRALESIPHDNEGWTTIAGLGSKLRELCPDYEKRYSGKELSVRLREIGGQIEVNGQRVRIWRKLSSPSPTRKFGPPSFSGNTGR